MNLGPSLLAEKVADGSLQTLSRKRLSMLKAFPEDPGACAITSFHRKSRCTDGEESDKMGAAAHLQEGARLL